MLKSPIRDLRIRELLLSWFHSSQRPLPWRSNRNAYHSWVSEIILQQTKVAQGLAYYENFVDKFPDVKALASADESQVMKAWEGLGYYSRARNLHKGAKQVLDQFNGIVPTDYNSLLTIAGIGKYTAAAIASTVANEVVAAIDGNVLRVISRLEASELPINSKAGADFVQATSQALIDHNNPGAWNEALMELGALICLPKQPKCTDCPIESACHARQRGIEKLLPIKDNKVKVKQRHIHLIPFSNQEGIWLRRRTGGDIWKSLYEPISIWDQEGPPSLTLLSQAATDLGFQPELILQQQVQHKLTHRQLHITFWKAVATSEQLSLPTDYQFFTWQQAQHLALPRPYQWLMPQLQP